MTNFPMPHPPIECADGFRMSVQASSYHYCQPRIDNAAFYTHYEVGFPSAIEPLLGAYMERLWRDDDEPEQDPTQSVYPCVPVRVVAEIIEKHGGLK